MTFMGLSKGRVMSKRAPFLQQTLEVSEGQRRAPQWRQGGRSFKEPMLMGLLLT